MSSCGHQLLGQARIKELGLCCLLLHAAIAYDLAITALESLLLVVMVVSRQRIVLMVQKGVVLARHRAALR